jgi:hypothetical protein
MNIKIKLKLKTLLENWSKPTNAVYEKATEGGWIKKLQNFLKNRCFQQPIRNHPQIR